MESFCQFCTYTVRLRKNVIDAYLTDYYAPIFIGSWEKRNNYDRYIDYHYAVYVQYYGKNRVRMYFLLPSETCQREGKGCSLAGAPAVGSFCAKVCFSKGVNLSDGIYFIA